MNRLTIFLILFGIGFFSHGQEKWDLRKSVDYALKNNITVQQADLQQKFAQIQLNQTGAQLESVKKQVNAGKLPELNQVQLEAQYATDSSNLVTAQSSVNQYILQMQILLNLDPATPFDVESPPIDMIPV